MYYLPPPATEYMVKQKKRCPAVYRRNQPYLFSSVNRHSKMIQDDKSVSAKETIRLSPFTQPSASGTETPSSVKCRNVVGDSIARIQLYAARRQKMCQRWLLMGHKPLYNYEIDCWSSSGHHAKFWMKFISRRWTSAASSVVLGC